MDIGKDPRTGKRIQKTKGGFPKRKDAEKALNKILVEIDENRFITPSKEPFSTFIKRWFYSHSSKRGKLSTVSGKEYMLKKHLLDENPFSEKPISAITTFDIDSLYNLKLEQDYSTSYIRKMHQMLNKAFSKAITWNLIAKNPVIGAEPPSVKSEEMTIWSFEEVHSFLDECMGERNYITFYLAIFTGMRRGEILALTWNDIDFDKKIIHVTKSLSQIPKTGYLVDGVKTLSSKRQIPISNDVILKLIQQKRKQEEWKETFGDAYKDHNLVVCTEYGKYQDPRNVLRVMKRLCKAAGVTKSDFTIYVILMHPFYYQVT